MTSNILARLGMKTPIIQAPMAGVNSPEMAAIVTGAGGLGSLGLGASGVYAAQESLARAKALCTGPINANVFCHTPARDNTMQETAWLAKLAPTFDGFNASPPAEISEIYTSFIVDTEMYEMLLAAQPGVVSFHFGLPDVDWIAALKDAGNVLFATATNLSEAHIIASAGIDAIVAQGWEAGGHRGCFDPDAPDMRQTTLDLVAELSRETDLPIIAAGGIMTGADARAAIAAGATAVQMGTAFVACDESVADDNYRARLAIGGETDMTRVVSGRPARCLTNDFTEFGKNIGASDIPDYPKTYDAGKALHAAAKAMGDHEFGAHWSGSGAAKSRPMSTAALMDTLIAELAS